ncbi:craniofacial development protein 2-like [Octopus bimaculoides]|uniref:craniofacial development protein 2-like n=1 Tax=Octopus bimaculoides TaxID=37653 RepID=UPI00071D1724|nr:craniofacial development protein 2-like [Octopus bimaculoides]|eukprot:XP_014784117.1 PREDICTED: craniofacial development protein 2-like [Octopus bimaculoides]
MASIPYTIVAWTKSISNYRDSRLTARTQTQASLAKKDTETQTLNLRDVRDARKTAVINDELKRLGVGIATLQETRLAGASTLKEKDDTFFWRGKNFDEPREHGVDFTVRNSLLNMVEPNSGGSARLLTLLLNTTEGPVNLVSVYAPTLSATSDTKDEFYENLSSTIRNIPNAEQLILLGDFNARVSADSDS